MYVCIFFLPEPSKSCVLTVQDAFAYTMLTGIPPLSGYRVSREGSYEDCLKELEDIKNTVVKTNYIGKKFSIKQEQIGEVKSAFLKEEEKTNIIL